MRKTEEVRRDIDQADANAQRLRQALGAANARMRAAASASVDLSEIDSEQLATGVNLDVSAATKAVRELERRLRDERKHVDALQEELYQSETASAVEAYTRAIADLLLEFAGLAERIEAAEELVTGVRHPDSRLFYVHRLRRELRASVESFKRWQNPASVRPPRRQWRNKDGSIEIVDIAEYDRRVAAKAEREKRRFPWSSSPTTAQPAE